MYRAHYLKNDWKYRLGCNAAPIGNDYRVTVHGNHIVTCSTTSRVPVFKLLEAIKLLGIEN